MSRLKNRFAQLLGCLALAGIALTLTACGGSHLITTNPNAATQVVLNGTINTDGFRTASAPMDYGIRAIPHVGEAVIARLNAAGGFSLALERKNYAIALVRVSIPGVALANLRFPAPGLTGGSTSVLPLSATLSSGSVFSLGTLSPSAGVMTVPDTSASNPLRSLVDTQGNNIALTTQGATFLTSTEEILNQAVSQSVATAPIFNQVAAPAGTVSRSYTYTFTASSTGTVAFSAEGTLPPGLTLSSSGILSGTPTTSGSYTFTLKAKAGFITAIREITIAIAGVGNQVENPTNQPPVIVTTSATGGQVGTNLDTGFFATDPENGTLTMSLSGEIPPGMTVNGTVRDSQAGKFITLGGQPTEAGSFNLLLTVSDGTNTVSRSYTIVIEGAASTEPVPVTVTLSAVQTLQQSETGFQSVDCFGNTCWAVGQLETLGQNQTSPLERHMFHKSTDGGTTWTAMTSPINGFANEVDFVSADVGFVAGSAFVLKTTNGGQTWTQMEIVKDASITPPQTGSDNIADMQWQDANNGILLYRYTNLHRTTDGGQTWTGNLLGTNIASNQTYSAFHKEGNNFVVAYRNSTIGIRTSSDNAATFTDRTFDATGNIASINSFAMEGNTVYAATSFGQIYKSTNAGVSWTKQDSSLATSDGLGFVACHNANMNVCYAGGKGGKLIQTVNGGTTWAQITPNGVSNIHEWNSAFFSSSSSGVVVGDYGHFATVRPQAARYSRR